MLSEEQLIRLKRVADMGGEGLPVAGYRMGKYATLLRRGLVAKGPMPPRNMGGELAYRQRLFVTNAGAKALKS